jgi:hypothetical protein
MKWEAKSNKALPSHDSRPPLDSPDPRPRAHRNHQNLLYILRSCFFAVIALQAA